MTRLQDRLEGRAADTRTVVCVDGDARSTWDDLAGRSAAIRDVLQQRPLAEPVLATGDPFDFLAALLACWSVGRTAVVPPNLQSATLKQFGEGPRLLLDEERLADIAAAAAGPWQAPAPGAAVTLYTSGSSGDPKPVPKTLVQLAREVDVLEAVWGVRLGAATMLATVPHHHLYGLLFRLMWPLAGGRPFERRTCLDADELLAAVHRHPRHALISSPSHLARLPQLLDLGRWSPPPQALFSSGAPLDAATAAVYRVAFGGAPVEVLGSTESGGIARRQQSGDDEAWIPLPSVAVARADDGALVASSPWSGGPCRLEDGIEFGRDGRFRLGARMDRIVKLEGKRVSLPEVEARLADHAWVAAAAVEPIARLGRLGAVVVLGDDGRAQLARGGRAAIVRALREHLVVRIERVAVPRRFRLVDQLPLNERGKIDRTALLALLGTDDEPVA